MSISVYELLAVARSSRSIIPLQPQYSLSLDIDDVVVLTYYAQLCQ